MGLVDNAMTGLAGAVLTGALGLFTFWLSRRSRRPRLKEAWRARAEELTERITEELTAQFKSEITYLRTQLGRCHSENQRLSTLLSKRGDK